KKGDVLATARIAGIMGAKKTSELIPLCHPLALSHIGVDFAPLEERHGFRIVASAATTGQTGVEMEALTAAAAAALTVYDMTKALDKSIEIQDLYLLEKTGGKSGDFRRVGRASRPAASPGTGARPATLPVTQASRPASRAGRRPAPRSGAKP